MQPARSCGPWASGHRCRLKQPLRVRGLRDPGRMASEAPSPPPASPEPELAQLRRKVEKLERELRSCKRQVREVEKLLHHTERLYQNAESNNQELRTQVRGPQHPSGRSQTFPVDSLKSIKPRAVKNPEYLWSQLNSASHLFWTVVSGQARISFSVSYMVLTSCPTGNGHICFGGQVTCEGFFLLFVLYFVCLGFCCFG